MNGLNPWTIIFGAGAITFCLRTLPAFVPIKPAKNRSISAFSLFFSSSLIGAVIAQEALVPALESPSKGHFLSVAALRVGVLIVSFFTACKFGKVAGLFLGLFIFAALAVMRVL